jgi:hypothetical protein
MFTHAGEEMETVDVMHKIWNGTFPANRCPQVKSITLNGKTAYDSLRVKPDEAMSAVIDATDPDGDTIEYVFEIMPESTDLGTGGDFETTPPVLTSLKSDKGTLEIKSPAKEGAYRLFFYARDGKGHCGTGNIPFFVGR